jgi:hypothetical protein
MNSFNVTLTTSGGFQESHMETIKLYFSTNCANCYVINEFGDQGTNSHVQAVAQFKTVKTNNVTNRMKTLYGRLNLEVTTNSIRVYKITHLVGAFIYADKELKGDGKLILLKGWKQSWIDKQVKENVKNIPHKMLKQHGTRLTQGTAGALIYEYAIAHNMQVCCKQDYKAVAKLMAKDKYLFGSIRHIGVFQDVCALFGSGDAVEDVIENVLHWL